MEGGIGAGEQEDIEESKVRSFCRNKYFVVSPSKLVNLYLVYSAVILLVNITLCLRSFCSGFTCLRGSIRLESGLLSQWEQGS